MIIKLYCCYDVVAGEAGPIFQAKNDGVALRQFQNLMNREGIIKEDYELRYLADYDTELCVIQRCKTRMVRVGFDTSMEDIK